MGDKLRVYNDKDCDYGVRTVNGIAHNIRAHSFAMLTEDDILYIESLAAWNKKPFAKRRLRLDRDKEEEVFSRIGIFPSENETFLTHEEIEAKLLQKTGPFKKWIDGIGDRHILHDVYETAKGMDLPASKLKILKEKMPEFAFINENE